MPGAHGHRRTWVCVWGTFVTEPRLGPLRGGDMMAVYFTPLRFPAGIPGFKDVEDVFSNLRGAIDLISWARGAVSHLGVLTGGGDGEGVPEGSGLRSLCFSDKDNDVRVQVIDAFRGASTAQAPPHTRHAWLRTPKHMCSCTRRNIHAVVHTEADVQLHTSKHMCCCTHRSIRAVVHTEACMQLHTLKHTCGCTPQSRFRQSLNITRSFKRDKNHSHSQNWPPSIPASGWCCRTTAQDPRFWEPDSPGGYREEHVPLVADPVSGSCVQAVCLVQPAHLTDGNTESRALAC